MANINMGELEKNAQGLNEVLNETNELLGSINDQKQDILATDTQIHHSEIDIRNTLRGQNKELDTQDTSLGVILDSLKEEIAKLERIYSLYEQIGTQIGSVNRGTKKAEEFEELRLAKLNEIKEVYRLIKEEVAKNNTNVSEELTNIQGELEDLDDTLQDVQDKGPLYKHYKVDQHALREINEEIEKVEEELERRKELHETTAQVVQKAWGVVKGVATDAYNKWSEINQKVFEFGRNAGLAVDQMRAVQKNVLESYGQMAARLGMTYEEIFKFQEQYVQNTGRAILMTNEQVESLASMSKLVGESAVNNAVQNMDDLGASTSTASDYLALTMARARTQGLDAKKASETFASNIKMASRYSFREGVNGVSKMALLSQQLKFNMESIGATIEKFSTIEGAIEASANIQMLGGAYAANFANPLDAMGEALLDAESFINRIVNTVSSQATFNRETGQVEMAAFEKARLREFAKQLGINYDEAWNMVAQQTKIQNIQRDIPLTNYTEEEKALIANKAQYDAREGRWEVTLPGEKEGTAITALTDSMISQLRDNAAPQEAMQRDVHEIRDELSAYIKTTVKDTRTFQEALKGLKEQKDITLANVADTPMNWVNDGVQGLASNGSNGWNTALQVGIPAAGAIGSIFFTRKLTSIVEKHFGLPELKEQLKDLRKTKSSILDGETTQTPQQSGTGNPKPSTDSNNPNPKPHRTKSPKRLKAERAVSFRKATRALGKVGKVAGRAGTVFAIGAGAIEALQAGADYRSEVQTIKQDTSLTQIEKAEAQYTAKRKRNQGIGGGIGSAVGGLAGGAAMGAAIGSVVPVVGTLIGGVIGGAIGMWGGDKLGSLIGDAMTNEVTPKTIVGDSTHINETINNTYSKESLKIEPLNLNLNGSIKLTSDKGVSKDIDINALLGNREFVSALTNILTNNIIKELEVRDGQGRSNNNTVNHKQNTPPIKK